ncbi:MAG: hypothetical protein LC791_19470, partial [Acidobacteria bacterium]|nr:hypothetical protein [Acidobacteriota bacterium]
SDTRLQGDGAHGRVSLPITTDERNCGRRTTKLSSWQGSHCCAEAGQHVLKTAQRVRTAVLIAEV